MHQSSACQDAGVDGIDRLHGYAIVPPRRYAANEPSRSRWTGVEKGQWYKGAAEMPSPCDYIGPERSSFGAQAETAATNPASHIFGRSRRDDIEDFPGLGPDGAHKTTRSRKERVPSASRHAHANLKLNLMSRPLNGPFDTEVRTDHIDKIVRAKQDIPGPGSFAGVDADHFGSAILGGRISNVLPPGMIDVEVASKRHVPPPTLGVRHNMEVLSNKPNDARAFRGFPGKLVRSNAQTAVNDAVTQKWETVNPHGPNRCRTQAAFNQQCLTYKRNAPAYSFGRRARTKSARNTFVDKSGAALAKSRKVRAPAPRVEKRDDFAKFFGYNPGASQDDLEGYFGFKRTLQEGAFCESLRDSPGAVGECDSLVHTKRRRRRRRVTRRPVAPAPLNESWQKKMGRMSSYVVPPEPVPGPGTHDSLSSMGHQQQSKWKTEITYGFGTD